jgi:hypothetical protein
MHAFVHLSTLSLCGSQDRAGHPIHRRAARAGPLGNFAIVTAAAVGLSMSAEHRVDPTVPDAVATEPKLED